MANEALGDKNIIVWDHNRDMMNHRANTIFDDPDAAKYAWGLGFHWYESWSGGDEMYKNVGNVFESYPDKKLLFTEGWLKVSELMDMNLGKMPNVTADLL